MNKAVHDRLDDRARQALTLAQEEAQAFNHTYLGTEHLLLGLIREGEGVAARVLENMNVALPKVRSAVEVIIGRGGRAVVGEVDLSPRARRVIELADDEARRLGHNYIGTEHLLLGLVREGEGLAAGVLGSLVVDLEKVRHEVIQTLSRQSLASPDEASALGAPAPPPPAAPRRVVGSEAIAGEKFTDRAREVITYAMDEAQRFNHNYVGTEHLLLGLIREGEGEGVAVRVLESMNVDLPKVRVAVEFIIGRGDRPAVDDIGLTRRSKRVIELAIDEARLLDHQYIGTEHLLLGLIREGEGIAAGVLESLGASLNKARNQVVQGLSQPNPESPGEAVELLYIDDANQIRVLFGIRAADGRVVVKTPSFSEILTVSVLSTARLRHQAAIEEFESLINGPTVRESALQGFFEEHPDFLLGSEYEKLYPQVVLSRTDRDDLRPDFLLKPLGGVSYEPAIVELKLPGQAIIKPTPRREGLYANIHEAVMQLRTYAEYFREEDNRDYVRRALGFTAYRPRLVLVVGRTVDIADEATRAAVFDSIRPVELLTYEDILAKYRRLVLPR